MTTQPLLSSLPLFPLGTVLFPGGLLPLRIFEVRYLDMIGKVHKAGAPFGVVSLTQGEEVATVVHERVDRTTAVMQRTVNAPLIGINSLAACRAKPRSSARWKATIRQPTPGNATCRCSRRAMPWVRP